MLHIAAALDEPPLNLRIPLLGRGGVRVRGVRLWLTPRGRLRLYVPVILTAFTVGGLHPIALARRAVLSYGRTGVGRCLRWRPGGLQGRLALELTARAHRPARRERARRARRRARPGAAPPPGTPPLPARCPSAERSPQQAVSGAGRAVPRAVRPPRSIARRGSRGARPSARAGAAPTLPTPSGCRGRG
eukprot:scaffold202210_cov32-Tisochrysis_lutea.AAC.7